jgi:sensor c-di-GMP phosphodiesterase-like protein
MGLAGKRIAGVHALRRWTKKGLEPVKVPALFADAAERPSGEQRSRAFLL